MSTTLRLRRLDFAVIVIAYLIFVLLGLPEGMLGVAWPDMQVSFGVTEGAVGALLIPSSVAFILTTLLVGQLISRFGIASLLIAGLLIRSVGLLGYAAAPSWGFVMAAALFHGMGSGLIDAGMNTHFAVNYNERLMNWLHASFGLGATLGPLLMAAIFGLDASWRVAYLLVGILQTVAVLAIMATAAGWKIEPAAVAEVNAPDVKVAGTRETLSQFKVWLGVAVFFFYAGAEVTAGLWSYSLFTETRGVDPVAASRWVAIYWGTFTIGRLFFGFVAGRWRTTPLVRTVMAVAVLSTILIWWNPVNWVGFAGLAVLGFAMAPVFPLLTSQTEKRLPRRYALNAVGYQVGAAGLGIALVPGLAGVLAERFGLQVVGPYLVLATLIMFLLHETIVPRDG